MKNYIQDGDTLELVAPGGGVVSGSFYQIGQLLVCAVVSADATETFAGRRKGVFSVTKAGSQAWTPGAVVYWDDAAKVFTTVPDGNLRCGWARDTVGAGAGETTGVVILDSGARENEAT